MPSLTFDRDTLLSDHEYASPHVLDHGDLGRRRLHGGFLSDGRYQPPRALGRERALAAWEQSLIEHGGAPFAATAALLHGVRIPNAAQHVVLLRHGIGEVFWNTLTVVGKIEAMGAAIGGIPVPDLAAHVVTGDDRTIDQMAIGHLDRGLFEAHGLDEGGAPGASLDEGGAPGASLDEGGAPGASLDEGGAPGASLDEGGAPGASLDEGGAPDARAWIGAHDAMWFAARDLAFGPGAHPDVDPRPGLTRDDAGRRHLPEIAPEIEGLFAFLANLLIIEFRAEIGFAESQAVLRDPSVFTDRRAEAELAAEVIGRIRTDEEIHVRSLKLYLGELCSVSLRTNDGGTVPGAVLVDRFWDGMVRWATIERPALDADRILTDLHRRMREHPDADALIAAFERAA